MSGVLFIHGMWSTAATFDGLRARLAAAGHTTHAPTLPFHDRTAREAPHPELGVLGLTDYIDFLVAEIARLPAVPVLAGHSLGGFLAQAVAARVQPPGLILLAPAATASTNVPAWGPLRSLSRVITRAGWWRSPTILDAAHARWGVYNGVPAAIAEAEIDRLVWDSGRVLYELVTPFLAKHAAAHVDHARLVCPALVITGEADRITPSGIARATARKLPGPVDYHALPGVGHWLFHEPVVDKVAGLIDRWLPG